MFDPKNIKKKTLQTLLVKKFVFTNEILIRYADDASISKNVLLFVFQFLRKLLFDTMFKTIKTVF